MNQALAMPVMFLVALGIAFWIASRVSGWALLARTYPCLGAVEGRRKWFVSLGMRRWKWLPSSYGGIVILRFAPEGLGFSVFFPFSLVHRPFLVPWGDLAHTEIKSVFMNRMRVFWLAEGKVRVDMYEKLGDEILAAAAHPPISGDL